MVGVRLADGHQDLFAGGTGRVIVIRGVACDHGVARVVGVVHEEHSVGGKVRVEGQTKQATFTGK